MVETKNLILLVIFALGLVMFVIFCLHTFGPASPEIPSKPLIANEVLRYSEIPGTHNMTVSVEYLGKIGEYNRETMEFTSSVPVFWFETENFDMIRNKIRSNLQ
jgi:hypothetical protein